MEKELRVRDDIIHELEVRLTLPPLPSHEDSSVGHATSASGSHATSSAIEMQNMQAQLEALHAALAAKDNELETLKSAAMNTNGDEHSDHGDPNAELVKLKAAYHVLQSEQEDLLIMLSDQDLKIREYKKKLKILGQPLPEDDEDDLGLSDDE